MEVGRRILGVPAAIARVKNEPGICSTRLGNSRGGLIEFLYLHHVVIKSGRRGQHAHIWPGSLALDGINVVSVWVWGEGSKQSVKR